MTERELQVWWSSLPISEKERIALKGSGDETQAQYPACTAWWNNLDMERQKKIYQHCVARHGDELREWKEGNPYGD